MTPLKALLLEAVVEVRSLRRENEILRAKVEVMDLFACVLHTSPALKSQGMAPDVAWAMQNKIDDLTVEENRPSDKPPAEAGKETA